MGRVWTECDYCKQPCEWTICAACERVLRDVLAKVKATPPASTPAPAWEWHSRDFADIGIGLVTLEVYEDADSQWRGIVHGASPEPHAVGPYPTAREAAKEAVARLRAERAKKGTK